MAHSGQVVYLIRLYLLNDPDEVGSVGEIAVMKDKLGTLYVWILVEMIDPFGVEKRTAAFDTMDNIPFVKKQFS